MLNDRFSAISRPGYNAENEQHVRAIDRLVHELGMPAEVVNRSYRTALEELKWDIKVKAFLPILVSKVVKERLLQPRRRVTPHLPENSVEMTANE
jgi:hypothetical protein